MKALIEDIHSLWFGELDAQGRCATDHNSLWFGADAAFDQALRDQFGAALASARRGELDDWATTDRGLIALIVLLDQFSRNIHRGTAQAFAGDTRALALACEAIDQDRHMSLPAIHRVFVYLPLEHHEDLAVQEICVTLFEALATEMDEPQFASFARFARAHRDVIARFGRFPHRNAALGRASSSEELDYLAQHGGF